MMYKFLKIAIIILLVLILLNQTKEYLTSDMGSPDSIYIRYKPPENDYIYYTNVDSPDNNIGQATHLRGNITKLKLACNAIPECAGFTSNGLLKNTITPKQDWIHAHKQDLYIKQVLP